MLYANIRIIEYINRNNRLITHVKNLGNYYITMLHNIIASMHHWGNDLLQAILCYKLFPR